VLLNLISKSSSSTGPNKNLYRLENNPTKFTCVHTLQIPQQPKLTTLSSVV